MDSNASVPGTPRAPSTSGDHWQPIFLEATAMGPPPAAGVLQEGGSPLEESKDDILGLIEASTNRDIIEKAMCWVRTTYNAY